MKNLKLNGLESLQQERKPQNPMNKNNIITASIWVILISLCIYFIFYRGYIKTDIEKDKEIKKLDSIVLNLKQQNQLLSKKVDSINVDIKKSNKTIIYYNNSRKETKQKSHETIVNVTRYSNNQLDSFFTKRYGGN